MKERKKVRQIFMQFAYFCNQKLKLQRKTGQIEAEESETKAKQLTTIFVALANTGGVAGLSCICKKCSNRKSYTKKLQLQG